MQPFEINFEPTDLAGLIGYAVGLLLVARIIRYVMGGRWPATRAGRGFVALAGVLAVGMSIAVGFITPSHLSHGWVCLFFAILLLPLLARTYQRTTRPLSGRWRGLLIGLRLTAGAIALAMLARPVLQRTVERRERALVGIMLDTSRSMDVRDVLPEPSTFTGRQGEPISRVETIRRMLDTHGAALKRLSARAEVVYLAFDSRTRSTDGPQPGATGSITSLATCMDAARDRLIQAGQRVAGLVVVSDGRDTSGGAGGDIRRASDDLATAGIPLYCVGVGNEIPAGQTRSLQARRIDMPERVTVLNRLDVGAEFLTAGLVGTPIQIILQYDGKPVGEQTVVPTQVRELVRAELSHVPREGGLHQVTVLAKADGLEARQGEAKLSRYIRVTEDKIQVMYLDRGRYERAAVARALEHAREMHVTKIDLNGSAEAARNTGLPRTPEEWRLYHVILLGDVDRAQLSDAALRAMADLVTQSGRGMAMLGGLRTLGDGHYRGTPLDGLFPVSLAATGQMDGAVTFELTPAGQVHACCRVGDLKADAWKQLPPFAGASRLSGVAPGAEVLMRAVSGESLLVVQQRGSARTAVVAFDSTWQWPFASESGLEMQRRFWRQLVLWLANRKPEVWVMADRSQYDLQRLRSGDERVSLTAGINDPTTGHLPAQSTISGEIVGPGEDTGEQAPRPGLGTNAASGTKSAANGTSTKRVLEFKSGTDGFEVRPAVDRPGAYRVQVEGRIAGEVVGRSEIAFVVESVDREMVDPLADLETLKRMAAATASIGGEYVRPEGFGRLLDRLWSASPETKTTVVERQYLVDDYPWVWLLAFVGVLGVEWAIRRGKGLV